MSLEDLIKLQRDVKSKFLPPGVQYLLDLKETVKPYSNALDLIKSNQVEYNYANNYKNLLDKIINLNTDLSFYRTDLLEQTKGLLQHPEVLTLSDFKPNSNYLNYFTVDFSTFDDIEISEEESEEIQEIQIDESLKIKRIITGIYKDNSVLLKISPREFEEMIAEILRSQGFEAELTKQTRDNGYDILAIKPINGHAPLKYLVECKRFATKPVGVDIIRSFKNVVDSENANMGIIVATSYFTRDAIKKKKETPYLLDFRDKDAVMEWVDDYTKTFKLR